MADRTIIGTGTRLCNGITAAGVAILVVFAGTFPLIVTPGGSLDDTDVLTKVLVTRGVVLLLALLWVSRLLVSGSLTVRRSALDLPVLAIVASAALSTALSVNPVLSLYGSYTRYEGLLTIATYAALFWLGVQFVFRVGQARWLLRAMLAGAAVECVLAISQVLAASAGGDLGVFGESATTFGGVARAIGTMANANNLAIWLAMLVPIALYETLTARAIWGRALGAAATLLLIVTLMLTFGRAAWVGAASGGVVTTALCVRRLRVRRPALAALAAIAGTAAVVAGVGMASSRAGVPLLGPAVSRLASIADPSAGSGGVRLHLYADTIRMVAQRPLVGFGPDTFGIAYPSHSTGDWIPAIVIDKAHSDILQVAATQGLLGVAGVVWLLVAVVRTLLRKRSRWGVPAVLGGIVAYQVAIQVNFAWFPVTLPFWLLLAAAVTLSESTHVLERHLAAPPWLRRVELVAALAVAVVACVALSIRPALANANYATALAQWGSGERQPALRSVAAALADDASQSQYSAFEGDLEAVPVANRPGAAADLTAARRAYERAIADGDFYPAIGIRLAYVDVALGDRAGALAAAQGARDLDPYGPAVKLVAELGG